MTAHEQVHHGERLTEPLLKKGNDFIPIGWDEALDRAVSGFRRVADDHGLAANAVLSGGSLTNEKVYLIGKLARLAFGTPHVDYNGRFCMAAAGKANTMAFGGARMMTPLSELESAEVVVVIGANLSAAFPVVIPQALARVRKRGGRVIVIDPRGSRFVQDGDLHLQLRPGTDSVLFNGLLREVVQRNLVDTEFVADRTNGFEQACSGAERFTPDVVALEADITPAELQEAAQLIGSTKHCIYLHGRGPEQQVGGVTNVLSIINLGLACGHVGRPGAGINMLTGQRNGQGGREWGQRCDQLPAGRSIANDNDRRVVAERWGVDPADLPPPGVDYTQILQKAGRKEIRGLLSICTNMSISGPDLGAIKQQMNELDHYVAIEPFFSASTRHADIILPGSTFAEEEGTITTIEGRVVRCDQAVEPVAGRGDLEIICELGSRLGAGKFFSFDNAQEVFDEMRAVSAGGRVDYSGMTWESLRERGGVFWPCPDDEHPGTPQLYVDEFWHDDGRARFHSIDTGAVPSSTDDDYPLVMTNGRVLSQFLSGNQTMRIPAQNAKDPHPILEVHPDTAEAVGLVPGEQVRITSRTGVANVAWKPSEDLRLDTVYLPYHWPECNTLVAADLDPLCKIPAFKYSAVSLRGVARRTLPKMGERSSDRR